MENLPGTYALVLKSVSTEVIPIGRMGTLQIQPGFYVYLGSAFGPGGVKARISHHQKRTTHPHWHIDYLRRLLPLEEVWYSYDPTPREHQWADLIKQMATAIPLRKFGASDCRCEAHLFYFPKRPSKTLFCKKLHAQLKDHKPIREEKKI